MQTVSSNFLAAVQGSTKPVFYADLWRNNTLVGTLPLEQGANSVDFDANNDVQAGATLVVVDPDGTWTPTSIGSPLTPFGSVINIRAGFKLNPTTEEVVSLGWYVITDVEIEEAWKSYKASDGSSVLSRKGARITVSCADLMQKIADYKFLVPTAPTEGTAWAEIQTLVADVIGVEAPAWLVTDIAIPSTLTYGDDRMQAIKDLAAVLAAEPVLTPGGKLTLRQLNPDQDSTNTAPTFGWNINVTQYKKKLTREGVYNIVVVRGRNSSNVDVVSYAIQTDGPTSFYSSIGPRPVFYDTDLLNTPSAIQAYADAQLATLAQRNTQQVPITALPNPAIQLGDYVSLTVEGAPAPVLCRIAAFTYNDVGEMGVTLTMPQNWIA